MRCPLEVLREIKLGVRPGYPGTQFDRDIPGAPEKFEKKKVTVFLSCRSDLTYFAPYFNHQARKRHININFFVRLVPVFTGFVPGTNPVCPWDKSGEKQGQTQEFSLFYTVEARFHRVCPWDKPGLSQGQSRGRRAAQKVYVKKIYVPFSLAKPICRPDLTYFDLLRFTTWMGHL